MVNIEKITSAITPIEQVDKINTIIDKLTETSQETGLLIGQQVSLYCSKHYVPDCCLPCDGAQYSYEQFKDLWEGYLTSENPVISIDSAVTIPDFYLPTNSLGVLSNFLTAFYLTVPFNSSNEFWGDFAIKFTTGNDIATEQYLAPASLITTEENTTLKSIIISENKIKVQNEADSTFVNFDISANTNYLLKYTKGSSSNLYNIELIDDDGNSTTIATDRTFDNNQLTLASFSNSFLGAIDLTKCYYTNANNELVYCATVDRNTLLLTCSPQDYEQSLALYGQCGMFSVDLVNNKFRVPLLKDGSVVQQSLTDSKLGKSYNAGLPNITGSGNVDVNTNETGDNWSGAFSYEAMAESQGSNGDSLNSTRFYFDASKSNPIYGNSDTVQMNAIALRHFVVVANGQKNQSMMDWSAWASSLLYKANNDLSNINPSQNVKTEIVSWAMPDYSTSRTITSGWIAEYDCIGYCECKRVDDGTAYVKVNDAYVYWQSGGGYPKRVGSQWLVPKGSTVTFSGSFTTAPMVYKLKGV